MTITIGTQRTPATGERGWTYTGVIRHGDQVLVTCGHEHTNRDQTTKTGGTSAKDCITTAVRHTQLPQGAQMHAAEIRQRWQHLTRRGFQIPADTLAKAKADCAAQADAYLTLVDDLTHLFAQHNVNVDLGWGGTRLVCAA